MTLKSSQTDRPTTLSSPRQRLFSMGPMGPIAVVLETAAERDDNDDVVDNPHRAVTVHRDIHLARSHLRASGADGAHGDLRNMRHLVSSLAWLFLFALCALAIPTEIARGQEPTAGGTRDQALAANEETKAETEVPAQKDVVTPLDEWGRLVRFERDIAPIFRKHCLDCHGPEEAKNDFRIDDPDTLMDYIEPEDVEGSSMYVDYLTVDDEDMLMPPKTRGGPLNSAELALIRVWIEEGAEWPDSFSFADAESDPANPPAAPESSASGGPKPLSQRVWAAQGFLHPATVHFPIALLVFGAGFVVLGWKWPAVGTQIPLACLLLGSLSAIASTVMGWAFAPEQGYGSGWDLLDWNREIDVHRWSGLIVTVVSTLFALVALIALWKDSESLTKLWKIGLLLCAGMVGAVGHQGGEMSYGEDFYPRAYRVLTGQNEAPPATESPASEASTTEPPAEVPPVEATADVST